jgi:peroxiredoxin
MKKSVGIAILMAGVLGVGPILAAGGARSSSAIPRKSAAAADPNLTMAVKLDSLDITPLTLQNNRINTLKLTFQFENFSNNLLGGKLNLKLQYGGSSIGGGLSRAGAAILPPLIIWPTAWTYPLTQAVFKNAKGSYSLNFDFLGETWTWAKITATLVDRNGYPSNTRQITLHRSTAVVGPKQGNKLNDLAYTFALLNQARKPIKLSSYLGKVVLIEFSYWNCGACQQEASHLEALYQNYKSQGFRALTVMIKNSMDQPMLPEDCLKWAQIYLLTTPVLADLFCGVWDAYLRDAHGYSAPQNILIDRTGKIRWYQLGYAPGPMEAKIQQLLAE